MEIKNNKILSKIVDAKKSQVKKKTDMYAKITGKKITKPRIFKNFWNLQKLEKVF